MNDCIIGFEMNESWCFEEFADELWNTNSDNYLGDCNIFEIILSHIQGPPNRCSHNSECSPVRTNRSCIRFSKKFSLVRCEQRICLFAVRWTLYISTRSWISNSTLSQWAWFVWINWFQKTYCSFGRISKLRSCFGSKTVEKKSVTLLYQIWNRTG